MTPSKNASLYPAAPLYFSGSCSLFHNDWGQERVPHIQLIFAKTKALDSHIPKYSYSTTKTQLILFKTDCSTGVLSDLGLGSLMEDVGFLEGVFPLTFTLLFVNLQSPPSNVAVVVVLHHNAVDHDASVQPPFTVRSAVQSLLNQQWDSVYLFDEFVLKFTGWTWWSAITPSECNFHSFSQVFLFGCKNLLWKWPVRKKFNLFFSLGSPRAPPKSQIAPFSQHPKSSKFGYSLSSKKEKNTRDFFLILFWGSKPPRKPLPLEIEYIESNHLFQRLASWGSVLSVRSFGFVSRLDLWKMH